MKHFVVKSRGYDKAGFQDKDLYNAIDSVRRREVISGDTEGAIGYLMAKKDLDKVFYLSTIAIKMAGVNNHFRRIVFGCALLHDENVEAYEWVTQMLLEYVGYRQPVRKHLKRQGLMIAENVTKTQNRYFVARKTSLLRDKWLEVGNNELGKKMRYQISTIEMQKTKVLDPMYTRGKGNHKSKATDLPRKCGLCG
ncbi:hypothetical protein ACH5RR_030121 [Cinchona calisaya]|uniref:Uncharacterized protein n=1 Tax=Cinchona calisaya TaxID=153742 RepID=A0ABD2YX78_9GENT